MKVGVWVLEWVDGSMTCDFTSLSTVFQSYQGDGRLITEAVCNGTPFTVEKISPREGIELGPLDQWASAKPTELPGLQYRVGMTHVFL